LRRAVQRLVSGGGNSTAAILAGIFIAVRGSDMDRFISYCFIGGINTATDLSARDLHPNSTADPWPEKSFTCITG
jgi:hypothetical protein